MRRGNDAMDDVNQQNINRQDQERAHRALVSSALTGKLLSPRKNYYRAGLGGMFRRRPLVPAALCLLAGDLIGLGGHIALAWWIAGAAAAAVLALGSVLIKRPRAYLLLMCILFTGGMLGQSVATVPDVPAAGEYYVTGRITGISKLTDDRAVVDIDGIQAGDTRYKGAMRLTLYRKAATDADAVAAPLPYGFGIGAQLSLYADVWLPQQARNEGAFDYRAYLMRRGVYSCATANMSDAVFSPTGTLRLSNWFFGLRRAVMAALDENLGELSATAQGIMLGETDQMDEDLYNSFRDAGFSHILAVSGMHVSFIVMILGWALIFLPGRLRVGLIGAIVFLYCGITGFSVSVVRAGIMGMVMLITQQAGYRYDGPSALALAAIVILGWMPGAALDTGFALTFGAVLAIYALYPALSGLLPRANIRSKRKFATAKAEKRMNRLCGFANWLINWVENCVMLSICVTCALLPLTSAYFGQINVLGALTSVAGIAAGMGVLCLGWLTVLLSGWAQPFAWLAARAAIFCAQVINGTAGWAAGLGFGIIHMRAIDFRWLLIIVPLLLCASRYMPLGKPLRIASVAAACVLTAVLLLPPAAGTGIDYVLVDVGQGDAQIITDGRDAVLIDVGEENSYAADYVRARGLNVEAIVITHLHADHAGALAQTVSETGAKLVYLPYNAESAADSPVLEQLDSIKAAGVDIRRLCAGDELGLIDGLTLKVLHPGADPEYKDANDYSIVLRAEYAGRSVLMTGDLAMSGEDFDVEQCDVLKVAHHGSAGSSSLEFLAAANPGLALISVAAHNMYGLPKQELLTRLNYIGAPVMMTSEYGMITVHIEPDGTMYAQPFISADDSADGEASGGETGEQSNIVEFPQPEQEYDDEAA